MNAHLITNIDFHHNLTMTNSHRNPLLRLKSSRLVNNLWYNIRWYSNRIGGGASVDIIGNKYKQGPLYALRKPPHHEVGVMEEVMSRGILISAPGLPSIHLSGNVGWHQTNPAGDQWLMAATVLNSENGPEGPPVPASWRRDSPMAGTPHPIIAEPVANIEASILPTVGASQRLDCNGNWVNNRDAVDARLVKEYTDNTGADHLVVDEFDAHPGGYPPIANGAPCADADHDGMPDVWEKVNGLNPDDAADRNGIAANGYTNLENYLNGVTASPAPRRL